MQLSEMHKAGRVNAINVPRVSTSAIPRVFLGIPVHVMGPELSRKYWRANHQTDRQSNKSYGSI